VTDADDTPAAPDLNDRTEQRTEIVPGEAEAGEAEADDAAMALSQVDADGIDLPTDHRSFWQRVILGTVLFLMLVALLCGTVRAVINTPKHPPRPPGHAPVKPVNGPIDGPNRVDRYRGEGTTRTPDGKVSVPAPRCSTIETGWWAFPAACTAIVHCGRHTARHRHSYSDGGPTCTWPS